MSKIVLGLVVLLVGCSAAAEGGAQDSFNDSVDCKQPLGSACTAAADQSACFSYDVVGGTWAKCCSGALTSVTFGPDGAPCPP